MKFTTSGLKVQDTNSRNPLFCLGRQSYVENVTPLDMGRMDVSCEHCGALHWLAERRVRSSVHHPKFFTCCANGKVSLPLSREPPPTLLQLYTQSSSEATEFKDNIVQYNSALAFTSVGVSADHTLQGRGPPIFRIHGELKHWAGALLAPSNSAPSYSQLYIHDPHTALQFRMTRNSNLRRRTMETLQDMLVHNNPYSAIYLHAFEVLQQYDAPDYRIQLCVAPGNDPQRYCLPTADEVGVIIPGQNIFQGDRRDIILTLRSEMREGTDGFYTPILHRIHEAHAAYAPLHYVLLFPYGEPGWHWDMRLRSSNKRMTLTAYTAYRLHVRRNEFSCLHHSSRLMQHYVVDMYAAIDQNRLRWYRFNQSTIRMASLQGIEDAMTERDNQPDLSQVGQRIILPASYMGGPRDMYQRFQDGMAISRYFKKIDIFLTMTANPNWPEITRELLPAQSAADRPDLVARVFKMKKDWLVDAITKKGLFGPCCGNIQRVEFQKRGLPHMHMVIFLHSDYKLLTPDTVDNVIWARWPDPESHPLLFDAVKRFMVHGPCGTLDPLAPCMKNNKCSKNFPKPFQDHTTFAIDGYPLYCRPNDGREYMVRGHLLDNRWIVPYPPSALVIMNCHINCECAVCFGSMKYLNKYIDKPGDCSCVEIRDDNDEIKRYLDGRYFSASEAAWRILQFPIHEQHPNVVRLQVHLPKQHAVLFDQNDSPEAIHAAGLTKETSLTAFFKLNADRGNIGSIARQYTYQEIPQHFTLHTTAGKQMTWGPRASGLALGRMSYVAPSAGERFYLRTLLTLAKGPQSFDDLKMIDGIVLPTFRDVCLAKGLLQDDGEWNICLAEAAESQSGSQLRYLFTSLLLFSTPAEPERLWSTFRNEICDDLRHQLTMRGMLNITDNDVFDYGLYLINNILQDSGRSLTDFPSMPLICRQWDESLHNQLIRDALNYDYEEQQNLAITAIASLYDDQRQAFDQIWDTIRNDRGLIFFIDGPGGAGKTYLYRTLCHAIRGQGWIILCTASTGLAALLLPGGRTAHSMFRIPVEDLEEDSMCSISKNSERAQLLRSAKALIYDECLMHHHHSFEALDRTLQDIRDCEQPMGGLTTIQGGDWQQILPVVPKASRQQTVAASLHNSYLWQHTHILKLSKNMRLEHSPEENLFARWLLNVGHGTINDDRGMIQLPESMTTFDTQTLINRIYGDLLLMQHVPSPRFFMERAILAPTNGNVHSINQSILNQMSGDELTHLSADYVIVEAGADNNDIDNQVPIEQLRSLQPTGFPPSTLHLKIGCPLILLRNLSPRLGLCNGTRMTLLQNHHRLLEVVILGGDHHGQHAFIPRITLMPTKSFEYPFKWERRQFPVQLAFAMSINKAEGQSLTHVGIDLTTPVFAHGQLYVALSRATSSKNVIVLLPANATDRRVQNVVYQEVLLE